MKGIRCKYVLPAAMLVLALACHIYDPHEYRVTSLRDGATSNLEYFGQHTPAWAGRISKGVNFPALVLDYPFKDATLSLYSYGDVDHILVMISPADIGFFVGVVLFWSSLGSMIDRRGVVAPRNLSVRVVALAVGLVFGLLTGDYAARMVASRWLPERVIGGFGIVWMVVLITYFAWRLARQANSNRRAI